MSNGASSIVSSQHAPTQDTQEAHERDSNAHTEASVKEPRKRYAVLMVDSRPLERDLATAESNTLSAVVNYL